jgi:hypothetical protein
MGGLVSQEIIKAITQKFSPAHQLFYYDAIEVLPELDVPKHIGELKVPEGEEKITTVESVFADTFVNKMAQTKEKNDRLDGLRLVVG